ncbi:MAG: FAD-dependent oxidoreductase [Sulfurifustis sp.]
MDDVRVKRSRREFIKLTAALTFVGARATAAPTRRAGDMRVVVIGGGFAGATCARSLKQADPGLRVTLITPTDRFITCPFSNYVIAGWRDVATITQHYHAIAKLGVEVLRETATAIDPVGRRIVLSRGRRLSYDRLVVAPGIDFQPNGIEGYDAAAAEKMPHAWKAGAQTLKLRQQLRALRDGANAILVAPPNPARCPPALYERASVIAHYLKRHKPKSKVLILDAKESFYKQALFMDGWDKLYPGRIEWIPGAKGGRVVAVDAKRMTVEGELDTFTGGVINLVPAQIAGKLARDAGLTDASGWCPVDLRTFESRKAKDVYVIGDAAIADPMPKSAAAASSQGKIAAAAIVAGARGERMPDWTFANACYSLLAPDYGISLGSAYRATPEGIKEFPIANEAGAPDGAAPATDAVSAARWYARVVADAWG